MENKFEKPREENWREIIPARTSERMVEIRDFLIKDLELTIANLGENLEGDDRYVSVLSKQLKVLNSATPEEIDRGINKALEALSSRAN